jgi:hypothetical protein
MIDLYNTYSTKDEVDKVFKTERNNIFGDIVFKYFTDTDGGSLP